VKRTEARQLQEALIILPIQYDKSAREKIDKILKYHKLSTSMTQHQLYFRAWRATIREIQGQLELPTAPWGDGDPPILDSLMSYVIDFYEKKGEGTSNFVDRILDALISDRLYEKSSTPLKFSKDDVHTLDWKHTWARGVITKDYKDQTYDFYAESIDMKYIKHEGSSIDTSETKGLYPNMPAVALSPDATAAVWEYTEENDWENILGAPMPGMRVEAWINHEYYYGTIMSGTGHGPFKVVTGHNIKLEHTVTEDNILLRRSDIAGVEAADDVGGSRAGQRRGPVMAKGGAHPKPPDDVQVWWDQDGARAEWAKYKGDNDPPPHESSKSPTTDDTVGGWRRAHQMSRGTAHSTRCKRNNRVGRRTLFNVRDKKDSRTHRSKQARSKKPRSKKPRSKKPRSKKPRSNRRTKQKIVKQ